jgi:Rrf2 family cysteine metabolism transcriptional repressor
MKLTTRSEYALLALLYLARHPTDDYVTVETIAAAQGIPHKYLEQIMLALKRARYVRSSKGQRGGYRLAKTSRKIPIADIVRLFDGALAPTESVSEHFYESTPVEREKNLVALFRDIRDYAADKLEKTSLEDVL